MQGVAARRVDEMATEVGTIGLGDARGLTLLPKNLSCSCEAVHKA